MIENNISLKDMEKLAFPDEKSKKVYKEELSKLDIAFSLSSARRQKNISQRELASLSGVPKSTIARIENGHNTSIATLNKLVNSLGMSLQINIV
ncbi:helix-turn-helix domain-containing protein [Companilactobacillus kedongensis]|uniref:helix-turn-helix domain-containing protein n=1 Tax=Companilactobacillus kedongensis TaxID=2486004 RepID=UPI001CDD4E80|nr:helix-turn-helix transcriptional regulator [Companilactobacillus kedongensis]